MAFRYSYKGITRKTSQSIDEFGNPIELLPLDGYNIATALGDNIITDDGFYFSTEANGMIFLCDYQPSVKDEKVSYESSIVPVAYKLFVSPRLKIDFALGDEIKCEEEKGIIVKVFKTKLNTEIWVR